MELIGDGRVSRELPVAIEGEPEVSVTPWVTYALIAANVLVYLVTSSGSMFMSTSDYWVSRLGFIPLALLSSPSSVERIFTSLFTHANILHIFFNMYFLYLFGRAVEKSLGHTRYLALYLISGVMASVTHTVFMLLVSPAGLSIPSIGASGAISGVLGAFLLMYPGTRLAACALFIIPICFELPAALWILFWFGLQVLEGFYLAASSAVAFFAHVGGFITGIALVPLLADRARIVRLRVLATARRLFGFIVLPGYSLVRRGLGLLTKTLLLALMAMVLAGALSGLAPSHGAAGGFHPPGSMLTASYRVDWRGGGSEEAYLALMPGKMITAGDTIDSKVLLDIIADAGLLYNPKLADATLPAATAGPARLPIYLGPHYLVTIVYALRLYDAKYNHLGLLSSAVADADVWVTQGTYALRAGLRLLGYHNGLMVFEALDTAVLAATAAAIVTAGLLDKEFVITPE